MKLPMQHLLLRAIDPLSEFHSWHYLRHSQRRQEHLASLGLPLVRRSVIEFGGGIGDHTSFFLDRGCGVVVTEGRPENVRLLQQRLPGVDVRSLDLDDPDPTFDVMAEVAYCYGVLYHLSRPAEALKFISAHCSDLLLLETCVSPGPGECVTFVQEEILNPSQSVSGRGCRPTRGWVRARLKEQFPHVYMTTTQPWHEEFPLDWSSVPDPGALMRAVFVASRTPLENPVLTESLPDVQKRH
jgi:hypothetical protein